MDNVIEVSQNPDVRRDLLDSNSPYCGKLFIQYPIITLNVLGHIQFRHRILWGLLRVCIVCLQGISLRIKIKVKTPEIPKTRSGLTQMIPMD